jgi:hypothetical protein
LSEEISTTGGVKYTCEVLFFPGFYYIPHGIPLARRFISGKQPRQEDPPGLAV